MNSKQLTKRQEYWLSHIQACQQQRISMKDYAQQHNLQLGTLYDAKCRLIKDGVLPRTTTPKFQKAKIQRTAPSHCIIYLPNGVRLEWPTDNSAQTLAAVLLAAGQFK